MHMCICILYCRYICVHAYHITDNIDYVYVYIYVYIYIYTVCCRHVYYISNTCVFCTTQLFCCALDSLHSFLRCHQNYMQLYPTMIHYACKHTHAHTHTQTSLTLAPPQAVLQDLLQPWPDQDCPSQRPVHAWWKGVSLLGLHQQRGSW